MTDKEIESKLVDLHTTSKKLEDLMLSRYPGKIFPEEQHYVTGRYDFETDTNMYSFIGLNEKELLVYLPKVDKTVDDGWYCVRNSGGDCIRMKSSEGSPRDFS